MNDIERTDMEVHNQKSISHQQSGTFNLYYDASFVEAFHQRALSKTHVEATARRFASTLAGPRILDVGGGTGRDTCRFQQWGYQVVGVDYSFAMIKHAQRYAQQLVLPDPPHFQVLDMRQLANYFPPNSFDGAWASASLIQAPRVRCTCRVKWAARSSHAARQSILCSQSGSSRHQVGA